MLTPTFHFSILQKFLKIFNKESKRFVEKLKKNTEEVTNISPFVSIYTLNSMCETSMGISLNETEGGEGYRSSVHDFGNIIFKRLSRPWLLFHFIYHFTNAYLKQKLTIKALHNFSRNIIETRKKDMEIDRTEKNRDSGKKRLALLDMLILAQKNGEDIDDEGIQEEVDTFMFEGHDTTAISISFTLMLLANNKHCQDKLYEEIISVFGDDDREPTHTDLQEMKYMERCIKESLRLYPSVPIVARMMDEDMTTRQGYFIPKGCVVAGMIYDMHRRADLYPEPDKFDPDRFLLENMSERHPFAYIPFSAGPRNCIGNEIVDGPAQKASSEDNEVTPIAVPKHEFIQSIKKEIFVELGKEFRNYRKGLKYKNIVNYNPLEKNIL
ncbi:hypothetical protein HHI36_016410 [Cryptolaemus montrouzieri]|uniref:Cytochrome P450 n=1 Tax=Cryptolaemus montrouzieri TaxID=559131 RepID=A0ABD2NKI9_9CUCU